MPRPSSGTNFQSSGNCWSKKSGLEKILIVITTISVLIAVILLVFLLIQISANSRTVCVTQTCIKQASNVLQFIDQNTNPCDDFYQFACGNFLKNSHGDENLAPSQALFHKSQKKLIELYWEPIEADEHKMVKTAKKVFRSCMNETEIEKDNLGSMIEALTMAGGWPVIEGASWNHGNFDWIRASSILRRLGYFYSVFLDVEVSVDPSNSSRSALVISLPTNLWDHSSRDFDTVEFMTDIAARFGARNRQTARIEMEEAHKFLLQLQLEAHSHPQMSFKKYTVEEYQQLLGANSIDWLHFINNILGRKAQITKTEYVFFQPPEVLGNWLTLIQRTPKKTQANYLMWKVVQATLPYLTQDLRSRSIDRKPETREEFCLRTAHSSRFLRNPMDIIYDRRYLPLEKKRKVEEIVDKIKAEFSNELEKGAWLDENNRKEVKESSIIIGQPGGYFDDKTLDNLDFDMIDVKSESFLNLYAQSRRNYQTAQYQQIHKSAQEILLGVNGNYIASIFTDTFYFDQDRPQYLNFGGFGLIAAQYFSEYLVRHSNIKYHRTANSSNLTNNSIETSLYCLLDQQSNKTENLVNLQFVSNVIERVIANNIAYGAYKTWIKENGADFKLVGMDFTPKQLFWISTTIGFCEPKKFSTTVMSYNVKSEDSIRQAMRNSPEFSKDFNCPTGSRMNPHEKCNVF